MAVSSFVLCSIVVGVEVFGVVVVVSFFFACLLELLLLRVLLGSMTGVDDSCKLLCTVHFFVFYLVKFCYYFNFFVFLIIYFFILTLNKKKVQSSRVRIENSFGILKKNFGNSCALICIKLTALQMLCSSQFVYRCCRRRHRGRRWRWANSKSKRWRLGSGPIDTRIIIAKTWWSKKIGHGQFFSIKMINDIMFFFTEGKGVKWEGGGYKKL